MHAYWLLFLGSNFRGEHHFWGDPYLNSTTVLFDTKILNMEWTKEELPVYVLSDNGWIDMELFKQWLYCNFLHHTVANRPLLLLLDGHSSHYNTEAISLARESGVIIFTLVPHTTHELQPLHTLFLDH